MRRLLLATLAVAFFFAAAPTAMAQNCTWEKVETKEPIQLQNKGFFQFWIGKLMAVCRGAGGKLDGYSPVIVQITHVTDKSPYGCGQAVQLKFGEMDDANAASYALETCPEVR